MSALTIGLLVVLPSKMEPDSQAFAMLATADANPVRQHNASQMHRSASRSPSPMRAFYIGRAAPRRVHRADLPLNEAVRDGGQEKSPARGGAS